MTRTLEESVAIAAIKVLVGNNTHFPAIKALIARTRSKDRVAEMTIRLLIARWHAKREKPTYVSGEPVSPVGLAIELLEEYTISSALANIAIRCVAEAGHYYKFPELPWLILKRPTSPEEVRLLVSAYLDADEASFTIEEQLKRLLTYCRTGKERGVELERIRSVQFSHRVYIDA